MKILTIIGARPQFIKAAPLSIELSKFREKVTEVILHTGQHFDRNMSNIFFFEMGIPQPIDNLNIHSLSHGAMTGRMLEGIEKVIVREQPDYVVVYGDTNSTLAGALAAKKLHVKVAHIEAGLRSFNLQMPEEVNRILTDRISDILFCPTVQAVQNLKNEGFDRYDCRICCSGDIMEDAAALFSAVAEKKSNILATLGLLENSYVLATFHRAENTNDGERLKKIVNAINAISKLLPVVIPIHPRTRKAISNYDLQLEATIINPVGYLDMLQLLKNTGLVITDSGGLQKEAFFFKKFCVTLRDETEWVELVENGYNTLVGADTEAIVSAVNVYLGKEFVQKHDFYGGGTASKRIIDILLAS